jgi:hypothetical protein
MAGRHEHFIHRIDVIWVFAQERQRNAVPARGRLPNAQTANRFDRVPHRADTSGKHCFDVAFTIGRGRYVDSQLAMERKRHGHVVDDQADSVKSWDYPVSEGSEDSAYMPRTFHRIQPIPRCSASVISASTWLEL